MDKDTDRRYILGYLPSLLDQYLLDVECDLAMLGIGLYQLFTCFIEA